MAVRARDSAVLQAPLVHRQDVPAENLLNELYMKVEGSLRQEILKKLNHLSEDEIKRKPFTAAVTGFRGL